MPPAYETIKTLSPGKNDRGIILRLVRKYELPDYYGGKRPLSLECIFHDSEGDRIHATVGRQHMEKFKEILVEGRVYSVVGFVVGMNRMTFKTTTAEHKILIFNSTRIFEIIREEFPRRMFEFKTFNEVAAMDSNAPTFDVIGMVVCSYTPQMINCSGKTKRMQKFVLEDIEGKTIKCTLWEKYAEQMLDFIQTGPEAPPGILLHLCTTNIFKGEVEIQNCYDTTKLFIEQEMEEIKEYKARYLSTTGKGAVASISTLTTTTTSVKTLADEHRDGELIITTLEALQNEGQTGAFLVYATIVCVEHAKDWAYYSCKICRKKLQKEGQGFVCEKCGIDDPTAILRYKLIVRVVDDSDTALLLLWDKECVGLLGKRAAEIIQGEDLLNVPPEIDGALANKKALFKVNVVHEERASEKVFSVLKLESDMAIITKVCGSRIHVGPTEPLTPMVDHASESGEMVGSSSTTLSTPNQKCSAEGNTIDHNDGDMLSKRLIDEFSTSIKAKKKMKRLKQEK